MNNDQCRLPTKILVLSIISMVSSMANEIAKAGCADECIACTTGDSTYEITCDTATKAPLLSINNRTVLSIHLEDHVIRVSSGVAYECYTDGVASINDSSSRLGLGDVFRFNISDSRNMLVGVGCDTTALVYDGESSGQKDSVGCITSCISANEARNGTCSGRGCCATSIFNTMEWPIIKAGSLKNYTLVEESGGNTCSVAFIAEANIGNSYNFSVPTLTASAKEYAQMRVPMVYNWYVHSSGKDQNCSGVPLCGANTRCVDENIDDGYVCKCLQGFTTGNPYLPQGCQDINECLNASLNVCETQEYCVNKAGGYQCECPNGFSGNATKTNPCIPLPPTPNAAKALTLGLSISLGSILVFLFLGRFYKLFKRRKEVRERENNFERNGGALLEKQLLPSESSVVGTKIFSEVELKKATDNFNDNRVLGRGGQGTVYKGMLRDGTIVAVKRSKNDDDDEDDQLQSIKQFINEVAIMSNINHRNIVKLLGCCLETKVPWLVYEFVPNGTLDQHIHNPSSDFRITWSMRFQIAVDSAEALAYLHSSSDPPTYHRDIKSTNILLDEKYKAKVSDFGISKNVSIDQTHVTTGVQGTYGYLDPEYFQLRQFTDKSDVYSFGVVLLELITSKKPISTNKAYESQSLVAVFLQVTNNEPDQLYHVLDTQVLQECPKHDIEALVKLTKRCLSMQGKERPTMKEVAMTLEMIKARSDDQMINSSHEQSMMIKQDDYVGWTNQITMVDGGPYTNSTASTSL